ncbi:P-loop containing nucleoside triphosphate hydrolase protein [Echria macrotheca]|uniref:RNA helicase n=1 Tax=Echria macrotheca TaxID=438768 RepID=A0AAJ0BKF8_9PEZI|nr:P-loop containing nucleoside triphosphate hydrolase protein [Echria macrotheca]
MEDADDAESPSDDAAPTTNGHANGITKGTSNGTANGTSNGSVNGTANGVAQRNGATYSYQQTKSLDTVPESEIAAFLEKQEVRIIDPSNSNLRPVIQFSQLPSSTLLSKKPFASFTSPTPIQSASWPFALSGRDVIGIAETGSGKTLAFSVPCVEALASSAKPKSSKNGRTAHARAVIVSPTRELAMQTHAAISSLAQLVGLSAVCLYGGASKDDQRALLRKNSGADIIVATPGRLKDFLSEGAVSLESVMFAVLDEADRMLDKGFEDDIKLILGSCPPREKRQTLMFTATWPNSVRVLAESFMVDPVKVTIGNRTRAGDEDGEGNGTVELQANSRIEQKVEVVDPRGKEQRLLELLREAQKGSAKNDRILVFCLYKKEAVRVEQFLDRRGIRVASIHGDLPQEKRTRALEAFKAGTTSVLVATDVAARGLDIPEVKLVINVTFPLTIEDYVHRIGRTGRAGKLGKAITLFTEHDKSHSGSLVNILRAANQPVPDELLKFGTTVKKKGHDSYGAFFKDVDMSKKGTKITFD